jgi:hypothetical protein
MGRIRFICTSCILVGGLIVSAFPCVAQDTVMHAKFGYDGIADCEKPSVRDFPIRVEGVGTLTADRHASLDVTGMAMGIPVKREHYAGTLGSKSVDAEYGSASLHVAGRSHLQAIRTYPNNSIIADLYVTGKTCILKITHRLNPGKRQYTFSNPLGGLAYCARPRTVRTTCEPI